MLCSVFLTCRTGAALVILAVVMAATAAPAGAERVCVTQECWTAECWWVGPGHRRCRRVCRRRCWNNDPPVYVAPSVPEPEYSAPRPPPTFRVPPPVYEPARYHAPLRLDIGPFFFWALVALLAAAVVAAISAAFSGSSIDTEIAKTEQTAGSARALAQDAENKTQAIDQFISAAERHAAARGRAAADKEWAGE